jgi:hypothetical protein
MEKDRSGYVYLLRAHKPFEECYKIGRTKDPKRRFKDFGVKLPYRVEVVALIYAFDAYQLEANCHTYFEDKRVEGEWFRLNPSDVEMFRAGQLVSEAVSLCRKLGVQFPAGRSLADASEMRKIQRSLRCAFHAVSRLIRRQDAITQIEANRRDAEDAE